MSINFSIFAKKIGNMKISEKTVFWLEVVILIILIIVLAYLFKSFWQYVFR